MLTVYAYFSFSPAAVALCARRYTMLACNVCVFSGGFSPDRALLCHCLLHPLLQPFFLPSNILYTVRPGRIQNSLFRASRARIRYCIIHLFLSVSWPAGRFAKIMHIAREGRKIIRPRIRGSKGEGWPCARVSRILRTAGVSSALCEPLKWSTLAFV